ncbi:TetR/AcrR family transcriptional regulator [Alkalilimnicola sp. S0819]|uniref:TetR/AcrR family transcriptional regulator n=1 Tax=Alkalilimnicola sp. S0819 TaxID=2613922 RepID=UPI0012618A68|nr:TetR/AcrR family transcriptional regulator [Alkalilimnicola sp. S0819]KAB7619581.1 TetR/AcrR family transcriptional regulator [Alkalilimnicola sp. S0819]MPQ17634.1 TetR family transcriptional regulator [Alkalilimnicola sp. S0819]
MAKPVKPVTARGEQTRQKLLQAAEQEFGEKGFHTASISSITQRAGVAQGTFYIYYASKEDIFKALVKDMGRKMRHFLTEATEGITDRLEIERKGLVFFLQFALQHKNLYRIVMECQFIDEATYRDYYEGMAEVYAGRLKRAQETGQIREGDAHAQAWVLMGIAVFMGMRYSIWEDALPPQAVLDTATDFIASGLTP